MKAPYPERKHPQDPLLEAASVLIPCWDIVSVAHSLEPCTQQNVDPWPSGLRQPSGKAIR